MGIYKSNLTLLCLLSSSILCLPSHTLPTKTPRRQRGTVLTHPDPLTPQQAISRLPEIASIYSFLSQCFHLGFCPASARLARTAKLVGLKTHPRSRASSLNHPLKPRNVLSV